jgi:hypothetical protein
MLKVEKVLNPPHNPTAKKKYVGEYESGVSLNTTHPKIPVAIRLELNVAQTVVETSRFLNIWLMPNRSRLPSPPPMKTAIQLSAFM